MKTIFTLAAICLSITACDLLESDVSDESGGSNNSNQSQNELASGVWKNELPNDEKFLDMYGDDGEDPTADLLTYSFIGKDSLIIKRETHSLNDGLWEKDKTDNSEWSYTADGVFIMAKNTEKGEREIYLADENGETRIAKGVVWDTEGLSSNDGIIGSWSKTESRNRQGEQVTIKAVMLFTEKTMSEKTYIDGKLTWEQDRSISLSDSCYDSGYQSQKKACDTFFRIAQDKLFISDDLADVLTGFTQN